MYEIESNINPVSVNRWEITVSAYAEDVGVPWVDSIAAFVRYHPKLNNYTVKRYHDSKLEEKYTASAYPWPKSLETVQGTQVQTVHHTRRLLQIQEEITLKLEAKL